MSSRFTMYSFAACQFIATLERAGRLTPDHTQFALQAALPGSTLSGA